MSANTIKKNLFPTTPSHSAFVALVASHHVEFTATIAYDFRRSHIILRQPPNETITPAQFIEALVEAGFSGTNAAKVYNDILPEDKRCAVKPITNCCLIARASRMGKPFRSTDRKIPGRPTKSSFGRTRFTRSMPTA